MEPWAGANRYVGFYWTYPVPAAGFTNLPPNADSAARVSATIRYQRDRVRGYVAQQRGKLLDEIVYLEVAPDRGTEHVETELNRALKLCSGGKAQLVFVDFAWVAGWRQHPFLMRLMQRAPVSCLGLDPEPLMMDGKMFDPIEHFRRHRDEALRRSAHKSSRADLEAKVSAAAAEVGNAVGRYRLAAERLNSEGIRTLNGRLWTAANVKQFLRATEGNEGGGRLK